MASETKKKGAAQVLPGADRAHRAPRLVFGGEWPFPCRLSCWGLASNARHLPIFFVGGKLVEVWGVKGEVDLETRRMVGGRCFIALDELMN